MYVSTFYSYKGGVGRTFALMNVAVELAKSGRSVLLVDFDLEAPGIDTFTGFENKRGAGGIVQFVNDYLQMMTPPDVSEYVFEASVWPQEQCEGKGKIWVMPAGRRDLQYDRLLSKIHWQQLYDDYEGFFLFEDLKRQWALTFAPDYVLIDSRTGHTDVGGICTRQLADLVVLLFTPNEQNLKGLPPIVKAIRRESGFNLEAKTELCFVASNVPTLDDEEGILRRMMQRFTRALGDETRSRILTVARYDSLQLLNQDIFALHRPKSRLARQYRDIFQFIVEQNLDDRRGVLDYLKSRARSEELRRFEDGSIDRRLDGILLRYQNDGEVLLWVARYYKERARPLEAISLLEKSLEASSSHSDQVEVAVRLELAGTYITIQQLDSASAQLKRIVSQHVLIMPQVHKLLQLWRLADLEPTNDLIACISRSEIDSEDILLLINDMSESVDWQRVSSELLLRNGLGSIEKDKNLLHALLLSLIGARQFELVLEVSRKLLEVDPENVSSLFNASMALWAVKREEESLCLFEKFLSAAQNVDDFDDANYAQCVSFAHGVLGNKEEALKHLKNAAELNSAVPINKFSCWSYFNVTPQAFVADLAEMRQFIEVGSPLPRFLENSEG